MDSHDAEFREDTRECANCGHSDTAHRLGRCIGNRNLCPCQHFWLTPPHGEGHSVIDRDQLATETAEYIVNELMPKTDAFHATLTIPVHYVDDKRPPTTVDEVKATLLEGRFWISWLDDRVSAAMRQLHGPGDYDVHEDDMRAERDHDDPADDDPDED